MITHEQMEEWLREVEERPASGALIVKLAIQRLKNLTERNEELLAENIQLRSGNRVEEYERRIANLEYQLTLLRRQFGGEFMVESPKGPVGEVANLLLYNPKGQLIRLALDYTTLQPGKINAGFASSEVMLAGGPLRALVVADHEELLFVMDTGRTINTPVSAIPLFSPAELNWQQAYKVEVHTSEELTVAQPIGKMTLFDYCVQISRRGFAKRMMSTSIEAHVGKNFIGAGIKAAPDKTCCLTLCNKEDRYAVVTREGYVLACEVNQLSYTIEEVMKIGPMDYLVNALAVKKESGDRKPALLMVTNNGKAVSRELDWLETAASNKSRGQAILSPARREAGVRMAGAAIVTEKDWGLSITNQGQVTLHPVSDLLANGSLGVEGDVIEFTTFEGKG